MRFNTPYFPFAPRYNIFGHNGKYYPVSHKFSNIKKFDLQSDNSLNYNIISPEKSVDFSYAQKKEPHRVPNNSSITFLDIFGLQLEFDDFLILGILLFLFIEGVNDQMLYVVLFMLLLS